MLEQIQANLIIKKLRADIARVRFSLALAAVLWIQFQLVESGYVASYLLVQIHNIFLLLGPRFSAISELTTVDKIVKFPHFVPRLSDPSLP
jgi:hypothetical protein